MPTEQEYDEAAALNRGRDILTRKAIEGRAKVEALAAHDAILCDLITDILFTGFADAERTRVARERGVERRAS